MSKSLKIYQLESNTVCSPYRLVFPGDALNRLTDISVMLFPDFGQTQCDELLREADIFIIQRMVMVDHLAELIAELNRRGIIVVYDIDDDLLHLDPASRQAALTPPDYAARVEKCIRACQAVQCATPRLAAALAGIHSEIAVLENQLDHVPAFTANRGARANPVVAYAAGTDHAQDWTTVRDAYNGTVAKLASRGIEIDTWIVGDAEIFNSVASSRKKFFPVLARKDYLQLLSMADVSIIPLRDSKFNASKSDVKFLESASVGTPVVASKVVYARTIAAGKTGLLFTDSDEFGAQLTRLVTDRPFAREIARAAYRYVAEHRVIDQHASTWESTYKRWHSERDKLLQAHRNARLTPSASA